MTRKSDDELYQTAFRMLHNVAEALKAEGLEPVEYWALMFTTMQDLQAADLGMGSTDHEDALRMQSERLAEDVLELQRPAMVN